MVEYRVAQPQDMDEIIDFINMIFSMVRMPHDFAKLLPKAYGKETRLSDIHVIAKESGRICGCLGLLPFDLAMGGERLSCGYLGSMSVHPRMRGQGVMGELMRRQIERAKEAGMDMMVLGGQRQRYEHAGFAACGSRMHYSVNRSNVRHALAGIDASGIAFRPIEAGGEDEAFAYACYQAGRVSGARRADRFCLVLSSFGGNPWLVFSGGKPVGYLAARGNDREICELNVPEELISVVIKAWMEHRSASPLTIICAEQDIEIHKTLSAYCEGFSVYSDEMFLCLNPEKVIAACMRLKHETSPLRDGVFRMGFGDHGTLELCVSGGEISVTKTQEAADLTLENRAAHEFVFGANRIVFAGEERAAPAGWFPLRLQIPEADRF